MNNELLLEIDCIAPLEIIAKESKSKKLKHLIKDNLKYFREKFYLKKETFKIDNETLYSYRIKAMIIIKNKEEIVIEKIPFEYKMKDKKYFCDYTYKAELPEIGKEFFKLYNSMELYIQNSVANKIQKRIFSASKNNFKILNISNKISLIIIDILKRNKNQKYNKKDFDYDFDMKNHLKIKETILWEANYGSMSNGKLYFSKGYRKDSWNRSKKFNSKELKKEKEFLKYKKNYLEKEIFIKNKI